jgi:hypothetical protein
MNVEAERREYEAARAALLKEKPYPSDFDIWLAGRRAAQPADVGATNPIARASEILKAMPDLFGKESPQAAQDELVAELVNAADAAVERWHSRDWKQPHTRDFIYRLAGAVGAVKRAAPPLSSEQQAEKGESACGS